MYTLQSGTKKHSYDRHTDVLVVPSQYNKQKGQDLKLGSGISYELQTELHYTNKVCNREQTTKTCNC